MIALYILLGLLLLIAAILLTPTAITIEYQDDIRLSFSVFGIRLWKHPKPPKKIKISDYTPRALAKKKRKEEKRNKRLQKKKQKKKAATPTAKKSKTLLQNLSSIRRLSSIVLARTSKHLRIEARRLIITVGSEDAAKTAILFGAVNQAAIALLECLKQNGNLKQTHRSRIAVRADFEAEKTTADIKLIFTLRVWHLLDILFRTVKQWAKSKSQKNTSQNNTSEKSA